MAEAMCRFIDVKDIMRKSAPEPTGKDARQKQNRRTTRRISHEADECELPVVPQVLGWSLQSILLQRAPPRIVQDALATLAPVMTKTPALQRSQSAALPHAADIKSSHASCVQHHLFSSSRSSSCPVTPREFVSVAQRPRVSLVQSLRSTPGDSNRPSRPVQEDCAPFCSRNVGRSHAKDASRREFLRSSKKQMRQRRINRRPRHIWAELLRARVPSSEELAAGKELLELCALEAWGSGSAADEEETLNTLTFSQMRKNFLMNHCEDLQDAGMENFRPAPIASDVQDRFLDKYNFYGPEALVLGYHGTSESNHASIFSKGLQVPGNEGVTVANGNAHGKGIYIAEKGAQYLSMSFLRGSSQILVCGVVDNTLVKNRTSQEAQDEQKSRFLFKCGGLAHRCHQRPTQPQHQQQQQLLGHQQLYKETKEVRHVGNAMVVFNEKHVAPLYVADLRGPAGANAAVVARAQTVAPSPELEHNLNHDGQPDWVGSRQRLDPRTEELTWLPPTEHLQSSHAVKMKRAFEKRFRLSERREMRAEKFAH